MSVELLNILGFLKFIPQKLFERLIENIAFAIPSEDRPEVILDRIDYDNTRKEGYLIAKNIGPKTALNIELSSLNLRTNMPFNLSKDLLTLTFEFSKIDNLDPRQAKRIDATVYIHEKDGRKVASASAKNLYFAPLFDKNYSPIDNHLLFEYSDSYARKYLTHFAIGKSGILFKSIYLVKNPKLINKKFKRYGIVYKDK